MYKEFIADEIDLTAAAVTLAGAADKLKRIGDDLSLVLWTGRVPEDKLVPIFWPYLMTEFQKLSKYKDFKADIVYTEYHGVDFTGIRVTYITAQQANAVVEENKARSE